MRRGRIFFFIAFIIIIGMVAVAVFYFQFMGPSATTGGEAPEPTPVVDTVNVIVVTQRIQRGGVVNEDVLGMVQIPRELFIEGMFTDLREVEGRMVKFDLDAGIPLTSGMLVDSAEQLSGAGSVAALSIPRGMVAISIPISRLSSISYAPQTGDHVNVIVTLMMVDLDTDFQSITPNWNTGVVAPGTGEGSFSGSVSQSLSQASGPEAAGDQASLESSNATGFILQSSSLTAVSGAGGNLMGRISVDPVLGQSFYLIPSEKQRPRFVSQNLLQDAVVLNVGTFPYGETEEEPEIVSSEEQPVDVVPPPPEGEEVVVQKPVVPDVITLIVSPQDAVTLNYLMYNNAQLTLALRAAGDDSRVETEAVTLQFLLDQYNIPVPVKLPYGFEPRTDKLEPPMLINDLSPEPVQ